MNNPNKRKYRTHENQRLQGYSQCAQEDNADTRLDRSMFIEGHEADIVHGKEDLAMMLEAPDDDSATHSAGQRGSGLIEWQCDNEEDRIWVDRYDARLLLTSLARPSTAPSSSADRAKSPSGWSDLPSDTEDTFFFSPSETEDFRREKRRRLLDRDRDERLRNIRLEEGDDGAQQEESIWGGSDEEPPDDTQKELMRRTATHILSSPNAGQLEMRILANHGADKRFAFLRGRWKNAWAREKVRILDEREKNNEVAVKSAVGIAGLGSYGDSEDEDESDGATDSKETAKPVENEMGAEDK